jgi:hypothetical protein
VEADANDVKLKLLGKSKQIVGRIQGSPKLETQTAQARRVVSGDAQEKLSPWKELLDFVKLIGIVKCHLLHSLASSIADVRVCLTWLSIDDAAWINVRLEDLFNFGLGGTVKASSELRKEADDLGVRVTFDRW